jgi:hypothetical protein
VPGGQFDEEESLRELTKAITNARQSCHGYFVAELGEVDKKTAVLLGFLKEVGGFRGGAVPEDVLEVLENNGRSGTGVTERIR